MKLPPYVKKRGNVYWFRRRVSDELIHLIGRGEFAESLWTTDLDTAKTRAAFRNAEVEALFEQARFENKRQAGTVLVGPPTPEEQQYIRDAVRFHVLDEDESVRLARPDEGSMRLTRTTARRSLMMLWQVFGPGEWLGGQSRRAVSAGSFLQSGSRWSLGHLHGSWPPTGPPKGFSRP